MGTGLFTNVTVNSVILISKPLLFAKFTTNPTLSMGCGKTVLCERGGGVHLVVHSKHSHMTICEKMAIDSKRKVRLQYHKNGIRTNNVHNLNQIRQLLFELPNAYPITEYLFNDYSVL